MRLKELAVDHPYYCSESNYYSNEAYTSHKNWLSFSNEMLDADIDMNLCFRWDIKLNDSDDAESGYNMSVFIIQQRKGRFWPHRIESVTEADVTGIMEYLNKHCFRLLELWNPIVDKS